MICGRKNKQTTYFQQLQNLGCLHVSRGVYLCSALAWCCRLEVTSEPTVLTPVFPLINSGQARDTQTHSLPLTPSVNTTYHF